MFECACACAVCVCTFSPHPDALWHVTQATLCYSRPGDLGFMNNLPLLILSRLDLLCDAFKAPICWGLYSDGYQTKETNNSNKGDWGRDTARGEWGEFILLRMLPLCFQGFVLKRYHSKTFRTERYFIMTKSEMFTDFAIKEKLRYQDFSCSLDVNISIRTNLNLNWIEMAWLMWGILHETVIVRLLC